VIRITYRYFRTSAGWTLTRQLGDLEPVALRRPGSTTRLAFFATPAAVRSAFRTQKRADMAAATRLGIDLEIVELGMYAEEDDAAYAQSMREFVAKR
jgi:hypothetical protein